MLNDSPGTLACFIRIWSSFGAFVFAISLMFVTCQCHRHGDVCGTRDLT